MMRMNDDRVRLAPRQPAGGRAMLFAGAALLAFGFGDAVLAQQAPGGQQAQPQGQAQQGQAQRPAAGQQAQPGQAQQPLTGQQAVAGQLRTVEQSLRTAERQISGTQAGQQPNFGQARTAVQAGQEVLGRLPQQQQGQEGFRTARQELEAAQQLLQAQQPDHNRVATRLREAADAIAGLTRDMPASAAAGAAQGQPGAGAQVQVQGAQPQVSVQQPAPQITVQQQQPQITVQQPPPQVTVQQPPPQVTIQQPEPRVTVQQAQPQVRVQQAEPQVTVQQPGQPQVTVQQPGQPQVRVESEGQRAQAPSATDQRTDQRTGAASAPAPAQSGGAQPQTTAASPAAGVPLQSVQELIGTNVVGAQGRNAGEVRNLLVDNAGRVRAAVVEWGGFLGIGERQALVPIERIRLGGERAQLEMTREELEALPRYDRDRVADQARERGWGEGARLVR